MTGRYRGSVLVLALWALSLLTVFSLSLSFGVTQRAALLNRLTTLDALYPIAYSGVESAKSMIKSDLNTDVDTLADSWAGPLPDAKMANGHFSLGAEKRPGLVDEERKINLNSTHAEILLRLFQIVAGLDRAKAEETVYCVLDWMDSDSFYGHPQYGAESGDYEDMKYPYAAKDAPYELIDELLLVKGMTPELFEKIRPYVTVYGSGQVNINTASREVLSALGFSPAGVEALMNYRNGKDGTSGTADDNFFTDPAAVANAVKQKTDTPLDGSQEAVLNSLVTASRLAVSSSFFSVKSHGVLEKNGASLDVEAVLDRASNVHYYRTSEVKL